jgi:hypothetical protein
MYLILEVYGFSSKAQRVLVELVLTWQIAKIEYYVWALSKIYRQV